jgi:glycosyltransferase involved in cell wall biosynthesis
MIIGCIDRIAGDIVLGWAADPHNLERRLTVTCLVDNVFISVDVAAHSRPDVADAGHGDGRYGFRLPLPRLQPRDIPYRIEVRSHPDGDLLPGSPVLFDPAFSELDLVCETLKRLRGFPRYSTPLPIARTSRADSWDYLAYHQARWSLPVSQPGDYRGLLQMWITSAEWSDAVRVPLLHPDLISEMSAVVVDRPASYGPISLFSSLLSQIDGSCSNVITWAGYRDFLWNFGIAAVRDMRLPAQLVSYEALAILGNLTSEGREESNGLTELWDLTRQRDLWIRQRLPDDTRTDRQALQIAALVAHRPRSNASALFPPVMQRFWKAPAIPGAIISRLDYVVLKVFGPQHYRDMPSRKLSSDVTAKTWSQHFLDHNPGETPSISTSQPAVHVVGYSTSAAGVSQNVRMSIRALQAKGIPSWIVEPGSGMSAIQPFSGARPRALRRNVALIHFNADMVPEALHGTVGRLPADCYKIGFLLWELTRIPECHRLAMTMLDEIWVPTRFVADIYRSEFAGPITLVGKGIREPQPDRSLSRADFALPEGGFVGLVTFDFDSSLERKNPLAAVRAFQQAFPDDGNARLVVKTTNVKPHSWSNHRRSWEILLDLVGKDPRIIVNDELLPFATLMRLVELADCYISLHRSEGFGYGIAEAMLLRRPVLVTDFSGSADFCRDDTAWLVPGTLTRVEEGDFLYPVEGAQWAAPDVAAAAEQLRRLRQSPDRVRQRAAAAYALIRSAYDERQFADGYTRRLEELGFLNS